MNNTLVTRACAAMTLAVLAIIAGGPHALGKETHTHKWKADNSCADHPEDQTKQIQEGAEHTFKVVGTHEAKLVCKDCTEVQAKAATCELQRKQVCPSSTKWQWKLDKVEVSASNPSAKTSVGECSGEITLTLTAAKSAAQ